MIKPLRTYHYFLWRLLAVLLPVLFILAISWRPIKNKANAAQPVQLNAPATQP